MKAFKHLTRNVFLALMVAGTIAACDSGSDFDQGGQESEEMVLFASALTSELALSSDQQAALSSTSDSFGDDGPSEPGFLWNLAATLADSLTADQKARLLNPDRLHFGGLSGPKFGGGQGGIGRGVLGDILTEDQKSALEAIREAGRAGTEELLAAFRAARDAGDEAAATAAHEALRAAHEAVKAEVEAYLAANLTADQQTAIDAAQAERAAQREERLAAERAVMISVLGITNEQADAMLATVEAFIEAAEALRGTTDSRDAVRALYTDMSAEIASVIADDDAFEIWQIHKALASRAGHRRGGRKGGMPGGAPGMG
ncbi:MAG: hypothetical protein ACI80V_003699 [Rhodothermales bacterium]|jgi:hypothetical protein